MFICRMRIGRRDDDFDDGQQTHLRVACCVCVCTLQYITVYIMYTRDGVDIMRWCGKQRHNMAFHHRASAVVGL